MKNLGLTLGLLVALAGCSTSSESSVPATTATSSVPVTQTVSLKVPDMHCPFACWPNVQKTLAAEPGVGTVTLAPQAKEGEIDNPVVIIGVNDDFNLDHAVASLADIGFKDAAVEAK